MKLSACTALALLVAPARCSPYGLDWKPHSDADVESLVNTLASQVTDSTSATEEKRMAHAVLSAKHEALQHKPAEQPGDFVTPLLTGGLGKFLGVVTTPVGTGKEFSTRWKTNGRATAAKVAGVPQEKNAYVRTLTQEEDPATQRWGREQAAYARDNADSVVKTAATVAKPEVVGPGRAMQVALRQSQAMDDEANGIPSINWSMSPRPAALASTSGGKRPNAYLDSVGLPERSGVVDSATDSSYTNLYEKNPYMADLNGPAQMEKKPWQRHLMVIEQKQQGVY